MAANARLALVRAHFDRETEGPLRERVYRALRAAILTRDLIGGDRITEVELASALDISRTPLREAFRLLQSGGLVSISDRRGIIVRGLGPQDFQEIYEIRAPLEAIVARRAALNPDPAFRRQLRDNIELCEFLLERERWQELRDEFIKFHAILQESSGNTRLADLLGELLEYSISSNRGEGPDPAHAPSTLADHRRIWKAIEDGDADAAATHALAHVHHESDAVLVAPAKASARTKTKARK
ncbi:MULTISPECIES: GntR family transcriptional regulator [unclassified Luteimonas]